MTNLIDYQPSTLEEKTSQQVWKDVMLEEYQLIMKNDVWEIVPRPEGKSMVTSKWVYKIKHVVDGSIDKQKSRFMVEGFSQQEGEDYDKTFALVTRNTTISSIISISSSMGWNLHHMDANTTFLTRMIEEEVYIEQPQGFEGHGIESRV